MHNCPFLIQTQLEIKISRVIARRAEKHLKKKKPKEQKTNAVEHRHVYLKLSSLATSGS